MKLMEQVSYYINMVGAVTITTLLVICGVLFYFIKIKKVTAGVEKVDTSRFKREDSTSYVPFEDVVSRDGTPEGAGMIVFDGHIFVGGLSVRGFDYPSASADERIDAQVQSVQFFNVVEKPTSFRQSVRKVDLSANISYHEEILKKLTKKHMELDAEYRETLIAAEDYMEEPRMYVVYEEKLKELKKKVYAVNHQCEEVHAEIGYMKALSTDVEASEDALGQKTSQIMFSFKYNPDAYSRDLSEAEIYDEAMKQLDATGTSYAEALSSAHFKAKRLSAKELIGLMRKHMAPLTGESISINELLDSSYSNLFVSSDSLKELCKKKITEEAYEKQMEEYREKLAELLRLQAVERERNGARLKESVMKDAVYELKMEGIISYD